MKMIFSSIFVWSLLVSIAWADCDSETLALQQNTAVAAANQMILESVDPFACGGQGNTVCCGADYGTFTGDLETACDAAGGQLAQASFAFTCTQNVEGNFVSVSYFWDNLTDCIGASCDPNTNQDGLDSSVNALIDSIEIAGFTCTETSSSCGGGGGGSTAAGGGSAAANIHASLIATGCLAALPLLFA